MQIFERFAKCLPDLNTSCNKLINVVPVWVRFCELSTNRTVFLHSHWFYYWTLNAAYECGVPLFAVVECVVGGKTIARCLSAALRKPFSTWFLRLALHAPRILRQRRNNHKRDFFLVELVFNRFTHRHACYKCTMFVNLNLQMTKTPSENKKKQNTALCIEFFKVKHKTCQIEVFDSVYLEHTYAYTYFFKSTTTLTFY